MKLPVDHRLSSLSAVGMAMIFVGVFVLLITNDWIYFIISLGIVYILATPYMYKHNIKAAVIESNIIRVMHNRTEIEVPLKSIKSITHALGGTTFRIKYSYIYILKLKEKYAFGSELQLRYRHDFQHMNENEPEEIKMIRGILDSDDLRTN
ncbi:hypothetical protein [Carboxylicivirga sp. N1Y90]|uniref:hypothetical protein n=1 Tax=Carboxylicivirga fragile TaxID=3417571 RepID=UPI003D3581A2|nr:hypothetical protein [Marinilabiliaceae bacterium N1Y90]